MSTYDEHGRPLEGGKGHIPRMDRIYQENVINGAVLRSLPFCPEARASCVGFLHEESGIDENYSDKNVYVLSYDGAQLNGYYSAITDEEKVERFCSHFLGWSRQGRYDTIRDLPEWSQLGKLDWEEGQKDLALDIFRRIGGKKLALAGELVLRPEARDQGLGGRLRRVAFRHLPPHCDLILAHVFEIVEVDGFPIDPPVVNEATIRRIRARGAVRIGAVTERFTRRDGVRLTVNWGLWRLLAADILGPRQSDCASRLTA